MNAYIKKSGEIELYYFSGESIGRKVVDKDMTIATTDKNTKLGALEYLPLGKIGVMVADGIYTIKKEQTE